MRKRLVQLMVPAVLAGALALPFAGMAGEESGSSPPARGQTGQPGNGMPYGMGPGMMGGYGYDGGPGRPGGYGYGMPDGMGPGMMGGYGPGSGPGAGGGYGYGMPYGMGPGMMEGYGYGMGPGMMGPYAAQALRLNAQQRQKIGDIEREVANKNWKLLGQLRVEREKLYNLYGQPQLNTSAISDAYQQIATLRKEMFENRLNAQQRMQDVLNTHQQGAWRSMHRGMGYGMMPDYPNTPD